MGTSALFASRRRLLTQGAVAAHVLTYLALPFAKSDPSLRGSDAQRYVEIVNAIGRFGAHTTVEYPPLAVAAMRSIGSDVHRMAFALLLANAIADLVIAVVLLRMWSRSCSLIYLALSAPILAFLAGGYDLTVAACVVVGLGAVKRHRESGGGGLIAFAVFIKMWPAVLIVPLFAAAKRRAAATQALAIAVGVALWCAWSGLRGPLDVLTFRGAQGWNVESVPGWLLAVVTGQHSRHEQGSWRVGAPWHGWVTALNIACVVVLGLVARMLRMSQDRDRSFDLACLSVVVSTMVFSTLLSPQYIAWLLPLVAICAAETTGRAILRPAIATLLTDAFYVGSSNLTMPDGFMSHLKVGARNAALVWLLVATLRELHALTQERPMSVATSLKPSALTFR